MTITIAGCGWFGLPFAKRLTKEGHLVKGSTTSPDKIESLKIENIQPFLLNLSSKPQTIDRSFFQCDTLVISIPPKLRSKPGHEYLSIIKQLIENINRHTIPNVIFISSTSVYGDVNGHVDETTIPKPDTESGNVLLHCESLLRSESAFVTTIIRFGGLIGPGRDPGNFFAGKKDIANGLAPVNLIHLDDCIGVCLQLMKQNLYGITLNAVSPEHPLRAEFYTQASGRVGVELPTFLNQNNSWKVVDSIVLGRQLQYAFTNLLH